MASGPIYILLMQALLKQQFEKHSNIHRFQNGQQITVTCTAEYLSILHSDLRDLVQNISNRTVMYVLSRQYCIDVV